MSEASEGPSEIVQLNIAYSALKKLPLRGRERCMAWLQNRFEEEAFQERRAEELANKKGRAP